METNGNAERNLKLLNLLTFLQSFRAIEGVLVVFFASVTGSFTFGMTIVAVMNLSASIFEVPTGILSDNIGRKKTILLYQLAGTLATLTYFIAESTMALIVGAIFTGFGMAMRSGAVSAFVYENLEVLNRQSVFKKFEGKRMAYGRYSLVTAGLVGTGVIYLADIRTAILVTLVVRFGALLIGFLIKDIAKFEPKKANIYADLSEAWKGFIHDPALRDLSLGRMIARGVGNVEYRFRSLFFSSLMPEWMVNLLGMLNNFISGVAMQGTHWVVHKSGILRSLVHIDILDRFIVSGMVLIGTVTSSIVMNFTTSIAFGIREIAAEDLLQSRFTRHQRATMGSLVGLGGSLIYSVAAVSVGFLADHVGLVLTMLILQPLLLIAPFFFYRGIKLGNHK